MRVQGCGRKIDGKRQTMAPNPVSDADYLGDKARRDLLALLEGVSKDHIVCTLLLRGKESRG